VTQVKIGERALGSAGCLIYPVTNTASSTGKSRSLPLIVVVGSIGVALILLLTLIVLRAYMRHRRSNDEERKPLDRSKVRQGRIQKMNLEGGNSGGLGMEVSQQGPGAEPRPAEADDFSQLKLNCTFCVELHTKIFG